MSALNPKMELVFEQISTHLLTQNAKSIDGKDDTNQNCMYRSYEGLKCAVGCVITDAEYTPDIEGTSVIEEGVLGRVSRSLGFVLTEADEDLLRRLQIVHDSHDVQDWPHKLAEIREKTFT